MQMTNGYLVSVTSQVKLIRIGPCKWLHFFCLNVSLTLPNWKAACFAWLSA